VAYGTFPTHATIGLTQMVMSVSSLQKDVGLLPTRDIGKEIDGFDRGSLFPKKKRKKKEK
jgi:hypothetical protein